MKKLKLNFSNFETAEVLTRDELKKIVGGDVGSGYGCLQGLGICYGTCLTYCFGEVVGGQCVKREGGECGCAASC